MGKRSLSADGKRPLQLLRYENVTLDLKSRQAISERGTHKLTPIECLLLATLMKKHGTVLTRKFLMKEVWDTDYLGDTRTLEVHICWLRKKIEDDPSNPQLLHTVRGLGYRFGL